MHGSAHQSGFDTFGPAGPSDRLFFAVHPDVQTAQRILEFAQAVRVRHALRGKLLPADRLHVTLHHLGDYRGLTQSVIDAAASAAAQVAMPSFDVCFDQAGSFPGRARKRPCVLRNTAAETNAPLLALQAALGECLRATGLGRHVERRSTPHVTLLYDERIVAAEAVPPICWSVHQFALVHSLLGRGEHRVLAAWELKT